MNTPTLSLEPACVAAAARKAAHDVALLDLMFEEDASRGIRERIEETRPDVIGIRCGTSTTRTWSIPAFSSPGP